jgi:hypothetical protein
VRQHLLDGALAHITTPLLARWDSTLATFARDIFAVLDLATGGPLSLGHVK